MLHQQEIQQESIKLFKSFLRLHISVLYFTTMNETLLELQWLNVGTDGDA